MQDPRSSNLTPRGFVQSFGRWLTGFLVLAQLFLLKDIVHEWLYVTTNRLYLEDRVDPGIQDQGLWQQFALRDKKVMPEILAEGDTRLRFHIRFPAPSVLWMDAKPSGQASYEVLLWRNGSPQSLLRRELSAAAVNRIPLPAGDGVLEITTRGSLKWSDLRIVRSLQIGGYCAGLAVLFALMLVTARGLRVAPKRRLQLFSAVTVVGSSVLALIAFEAMLTIAGPPASVLKLRRDLGEAGPDPQWQDTARYGVRLRPNLDTMLQWEDGDIARMGYVPIAAGPKPVYRYPLHTDVEGFRNLQVRSDIQAVALGDSFTDALTLPASQIWTTRLEQALGGAVQNYGTAGFGPQQELLVLKDYAIQHRPHFVLTAFFAGNDIFNAETFEQFENSKTAGASAAAGWKIKQIVPRYETFYTYTLARLAVEAFTGHRIQAREQAPESAPFVQDTASAETSGISAADSAEFASPAFDSGRFTVPVNGRTLRFALMPPYLQTLNFSKAALAARRGWQLTKTTLLEMNEVAKQHGAAFVIVFIPFKSQVYLPTLRRSFARDDLERAFKYYFRQQSTRFDLEEMSNNRLAQNELMKEFSDEAHIPLLDLTSALQAEVETGRDMYFSDDAHWNAAGHELAATQIAAFLKR